MARIFNVDNWRIDARFEAFNIFNAGTVLGINNGTGTTYGGQAIDTWEASRVMTGRVLRLSMTARF